MNYASLRKILSTLAVIAVLTLMVAPIAPIGVVKAQGTIVLSSPNLNPYKAIELDIRLPGVDAANVTLRLYCEGSYIGEWNASKLVTGRYIAYLLGHNATIPTYPKVNATMYGFRLPDTISYTKTTTLTVEVLGYDVMVDIPFKPVATSLSVDRTTIPARTDLQDKYFVTLTISDQDLNFDPTKIDVFNTIDNIGNVSIKFTLIKRTTTGETFSATVNSTRLVELLQETGASIRETSANSGVFTLPLNCTQIIELIRNATRLDVKFDAGDLLIIEVASNITAGTVRWGNDCLLADSKMVNVVYTYPTVSVEFTNQFVTITINSPDDNVRPGVKDTLAQPVYLSFYVDGTEVPIMILGGNFTETDVNTGVFRCIFSVNWSTSPVVDITGKVISLQTGKSSFEVRARYLDILGSGRYFAVEPKITVERATARIVALSIEDPDLNNDPKKLELLSSDVSGNVISFSKGGVVLYRVFVMDSAGGTISLPTSYSPTFIESDVNSNVFQLLLPSYHDGVVFAPGKSYIIRIEDLTGPRYIKTITVTIAEIKVELDRSVYPINLDKNVTIHVTLYDDRLNWNATLVNKTAKGVLKYYIYNPTIGRYINATSGELNASRVDHDVDSLEETGPNTGIFVGKIEINRSVVSPAWIGAKIVVYRAGEEAFKAEGRFEVYQVAPGDLSVDKTIVPINGTIVITVYDPDANVDSKVKDSVSVDVYVDGVKRTVTWMLVETDVNTGTFRYTVSVARDIPGVSPASTIRFEYVDKTPIRDPTAPAFGAPVRVSATVKVASYTGVLAAPKDWIGPYEIMTITVVDPDLNLNPLAAENANVTVTLEGTAVTKTLTLTETGVNTGVFAGKLSLGWWEKGIVEYTVDPGDIREKGYIGKRITILYEDAADETGSRRINVVTLTIRAVDAEVLTDKEAVNLGEVLTITIRNLDIAGNPRAEFRRVIVKSTTYPVGIAFFATEVSPGVYQVKVTPVSLAEWVVGAPQVPAKLGDVLTIEYVDQIAADGTSKMFSKTVTVGVPIERPVPASEVKFADPITGAVKTAGKVGEMILLQATVKNVDVVERACTVVFRVKDAAGAAIYIGTASAKLAPGQEFAPGVTWIPTIKGDYTVEVLVIKSLAEPTPYSDKLTTSLTVT